MSRLRPLDPGVWAVLATPFRGRDLEVDHASLASEVAFFRQHSVVGLVALGVFGEADRLSPQEREAVVRAVREAAGGLPIVVGVPAMAPAEAVEGARAAAAAADGELAGVMILAGDADARDLADTFSAVRAAAGVGVVAQDYPAKTGVTVAPAALAAAVGASDAVVAVKSESPPTAVAVAGLSQAVDVPVFGGLGGVGLLDEMAAGSAGAMTGFSHPEALTAAVAGFRSGGFAAARRAYEPWLPLANFEGQAGVGLALRKEILRRRGAIAESAVRPPSAPLPDELLPLLDLHLDAVSRLGAS